MWTYEKRLQYPVKIKNPNPALAKLIISQYGGPNGTLVSSKRKLCGFCGIGMDDRTSYRCAEGYLC